MHLCDVEDHADGWKAYKHSRFIFDAEFDEVVREFISVGDPADSRTLILNGDILDFDLVQKSPKAPPWPVSAGERQHGLDPTEEKSVWKLEQVLADHMQFIATLVHFMAVGNTIVYVFGNHDAEFHFPAVRQRFVQALRDCAAQLQLHFDESRVQFEQWFYYVPNEIYVEHGQQYDYYTSFRSLLSPLIKNGEETELALPMGNLSNRYLMTRMGYFNPHSSDFYLNAFRYVAHWVRYYAFSKRSLLFVWAIGSLQVLFKLQRTRSNQFAKPPDTDALLQEFGRVKNLPFAQLRELDKLKQGPISDRIYRVIRELWIDRVLFCCVVASGTIALALSSVPTYVKVLVPLCFFLLLYTVYEWLFQGDNLFSVQRRILSNALSIVEIFPVKVVVFGHTHDPELIPLIPDVTYVNTGTWAPVPLKRKHTGLRLGRRNVVTVVFDEHDKPRISLDTRLPEETADAALIALKRKS